MDLQIQFDASQHVGERCYKHSDGLTYEISEDGLCATVAACDPEVVEANVANEIVVDGTLYPVTAIGYSFSKKENLKVVSLPSNVYICNQAFESCNLDCLILPASLTKLHGYAFNGCSINKLVLNGCVNVDLSSLTVESICYDTYDTFMAMENRPRLMGDLFINGEKVTTLVVPEGVTELPSYLICGCMSVEEVVIPSTIKVIGGSAFNGCKNLKKVNLPEGLEKIGAWSFSKTAISEVSFPSTLTLIGDAAFESTKLERVDIPEGVDIKGSAFNSCYGLKSVKLPQSLGVIRDSLFYSCLSLTEITIPESVTAIERLAFYGCKLTSLVLPAGLKTIGDEAFGFLPITEITIPASVTHIGEFVFEGCESLATVRSLIENPAECEVAAFEYPARRGGQRGFSDRVHYIFGKEVFYKQATLYVPNVKGMVAAYKKKAAWKKFSSIVMSE